VPSLDELANKYKTDKGTLYPNHNVHGYAPIYEKYLGKWRESNIRILEIGIYLEYPGGQSIQMWLEYFQNAMVYGFDMLDMSYLHSDRVTTFRGDQGNREHFKSMYSAFGEEPFDFILEDGSHEHHHQMISFGATFPYVKSGGYYILEDISIPGRPVCCIRNDDTYPIIEAFRDTGKIFSDHLTVEEIQYLEENVDTIDIYPDIKDAYATAIIKKK
jgi:23S rRNA U2552 (ribose-2'-O)-methylase RlmE/FtsJ